MKQAIMYCFDFRPISLRSFFNKFNSKIMMGRLALILPKIIYIGQTGFVKGLGIFNNVILAQELIHDINFHRKGGNYVLKLDITKANNNFNCTFLNCTLELFGFNFSFMYLIKNSFENCFFYIVINVKIQGFFHSSQELK